MILNINQIYYFNKSKATLKVGIRDVLFVNRIK